MTQIEEMRKSSRVRFFRNTPKKGDMDDFTFNIWKSELEKELPQFWESLNESKKEDAFVNFSLGKHK